MPSKALLRPGELLAEARRIPGVSEALTGGLDVAAVLERRDEIIHGLDDSHMEPWLEQRNCTLFREAGRLEGERRVRVGDDVLTARRAVVVATGSAPLLPPIEGLREAEPKRARLPGALSAWRPVFFVTAGLVIFGLAIERLGLVVSIVLLITIAAFAARNLRPLETIAAALVLIALCWGIFILGLGLTIRVWPEW